MYEFTCFQFASIILYRDREQKQLAEETLKEEEQKKSAPILTKILPVTKFYKADE
jgi:peptide methionine sulfoxide reductase MsrA